MTDRTPRRGLMLIVSSPSGAGKTSLCRRLMAGPRRTGAVDLRHHSAGPSGRAGRARVPLRGRARFAQLKDEGAFLEEATVHEHAYGSPRGPVDEALTTGRDVLFDIDWQGAQRISQAAPADVVRVFILPPSIAELRRRLYARAQDQVEVIERRVSRAQDEIRHWREYDYVIVNDDFDRSYADLAHIYHAERTRPPRNGWVGPFVDGLLSEPT
jgi:guanylate kinase